jgi:two-component system sensor histidine kinase KdpD
MVATLPEDEPDLVRSGPETAAGSRSWLRRKLGPYFLAMLIVAGASVLAILLVRPHLELADVVMVYLVGIILVSTRVGYGPSLFAALLSVASLDFFCVPPIFTFAVSDLQHVITFAVMLLVAVVMTTLTDRMRRHAIAATTLAAEVERAHMQAESERLRNTLFSSVSHDLRTPLAAITGAAAVLEQDGSTLSTTQLELVETIHAQAERLSRLLTNLLEMARLESASLRLRREWQPLDEVIGSVLHRLEKGLAGRDVTAEVAPDLPLAEVDAVLMEQALLNILENALKYSPPGSPIDVSARREGDGAVVIEIADRGPGLPAGEEERIFEKFNRAGASAVPGFGLGLTICRGIIEAHGGQVRARNRDGGGAVFRIVLPVIGAPPAVRDSEDALADAR